MLIRNSAISCSWNKLATTFHFLHMEAAWDGETVNAADKSPWIFTLSLTLRSVIVASAEVSSSLREMSKNKAGVNLK